MNHSSALRFAPALLALVLFLPAFSPAAQNTPTLGDAALAKPANPGPFTLEISRGYIMENGKPSAEASIGNILEYLKKRDDNFSLSLGPGAANLRLSDLILRMPHFEIHAICDALVGTSGGKLNANNYGDNLLSLNLTEGEQGRELAVFNLTNYLNPDGKADDKAIQERIASISDIIFKTLSDLDPSFGDATQPHYQFHKGANLLVVTGTNEDIHVATQVINALIKPASGPFSQTGPDQASAALKEADLIMYQSLLNKSGQTDSTKILQLLDEMPQGTPESAKAELILVLDALLLRIDKGDSTPQTRDMILRLQSLSNTYSPMSPVLHQAILDAKNILSLPPSPSTGGGGSSGGKTAP